MSPEELTTFLRGKGFSEDVVQDTVVVYLEHPPRNPKAWACAVARNLRFKQKLALARISTVLVQELPDYSGANALRLALVRQQLDRVMAGKLKNPRSPRPDGRTWGHRPRGGGIKGWREDYQALLNERQLR